MSSVIDSVLDTYLHTYRDLIVVGRVEGSAVLSFPFHLAAGHRIELTVTDFGEDRCTISDSARTLGEIDAAGYSLTAAMIQRLEQLAGTSGVVIVDGHLILESTYQELGAAMQRFLEMSKTIGDVYLVHKQREKPDDEIVSKVREILDSEGVVYRVGERVRGEIEDHPFDLVVPSNGRSGLAVSVLSGLNTHNVAQIWGFKCDDIKRGQWYRQTRTKLMLVYDVRYRRWSDVSRMILESRADAAISSDSLSGFRAQLG